MDFARVLEQAGVCFPITLGKWVQFNSYNLIISLSSCVLHFDIII